MALPPGTRYNLRHDEHRSEVGSVMSDQPSRCEFNQDGMVVRFERTIAGTVEAIPPVVDQVMSVVREMRCATGSEFEIEVAINEALANAVEHGCGHDPAKRISITVECDPAQGMLIIVSDPGEGFDPLMIPNPVVGERIYADHGRGIFLINELMDEVRYEKGGTEIWMRKKR
jgi:serine/threonine-protein kinase RsbW